MDLATSVEIMRDGMSKASGIELTTEQAAALNRYINQMQREVMDRGYRQPTEADLRECSDRAVTFAHEGLGRS